MSDFQQPDFQKHGYARVGVASPPVHIAAPQANAAEIVSILADFKQSNCSLVLFPELSLTAYTAEDLFFSTQLLRSAREALHTIAEASKDIITVVGLPWQLDDGRLLNCAAVVANGSVIGMVPKISQPNYGEFYEQRWFVSGAGIDEVVCDPVLGQFWISARQLFACEDFRFGIEICEDLWAPEPPGVRASLAGAEVLLNLSASNELVAKADYRRDLIRMTSARSLTAYVYASAGPTESTKDVVFGGHLLVAENGQLLAESDRFALQGSRLECDIDLANLRHDRMANTTFAQAVRPEPYHIVDLPINSKPLTRLQREYDAHPFVPEDEAQFDARARDILAIQATGLARRMLAAKTKNLVIGLSGGLDSSLAFLVALAALKKLDLPTDNLHTITMPGPGTTDHTKITAKMLGKATNVIVREISIVAAVEQHLKDLNHDTLDVVFENAQARERTQILFNYANKYKGLVVGTGDMSELALGWCTFNADHMANYNVNASVPKTMIAYLVRWYAQHEADKTLADVLQRVLETPISPELLPTENNKIVQHTEEIIGPYELHDFFLYHFVRHGSTKEKLLDLAEIAFTKKYTREVIEQWLTIFFKRFYSQQFKRSTLPPGPKVGSVSLSPRGDWRMPDEVNTDEII